MNVRVDVRELLAFYDAREDARPYASAIKGLFGEELGFALLCEHFRREGGVAERLDLPCTTGARIGPRLDGWLKVVRAGTTTLYQVEVKTWAMHSFGGAALAVDATTGETEDFMRRTWQQYWTGNDFADKPLKKVLTPMKPPTGEHTVEPLACLWAAMSPNGQDAFFSVPIQDGSFPRVYVFSMSSFLRQLAEPFLVLGLPSLNARLGHLRAIFPAWSGPDMT
jgi:hypothetical protein